MNRLQLYLTVTVCLSVRLTTAQTPLDQLSWLTQLDGGAMERTTFLKIDRDDHLVLGSRYYNYGSPESIATFQNDTLWSDYNTTYDVALLKFDQNSTLLWHKRITGDAEIHLFDLEVDDENNILCWIVSVSEMHFDGQTFDRGQHVLKLGPDGQFLWHITIAGTYWPFEEGPMTLDCENNVILAGQVSYVTTDVVIDTVVFPPDTFLIYASAPDTLRLGGTAFFPPGADNIFIARLSPDGQVTWVRQFAGDMAFGAVSADYGTAITVLGSTPVDHLGFDGQLLDIDTGYEKTAFLLRLQSDGTVHWVRPYFSNLTPRDVRHAPDGSCYAGGYYNLKTYYGQQLVSSNGYQDALVFRVDAEGNLEWARTAGGPKSDLDVVLGVAKNSEVVVTGYTNNVGEMARRFSTVGDVVWILPQPAGVGNFSSSETVFDSEGALYNTGRFNGTFGLGSTLLPWSSVGNHIYLAKFAEQDLTGKWIDCELVSAPAPPDAGVTVFPNPTAGSVTISAPEALQRLRLFDVQGRQLVGQNDLTANQATVNLLPYTAGIYLLEIKTRSGTRWTRVVKQ